MKILFFLVCAFVTLTTLAQTNVTNVAIAQPSLYSPSAPICAEKITSLSTTSYFTDGRITQDQCRRDCIAACEASASGGGTPSSYYCIPNITSSPCYTGCVAFTPVVYTYEWQYHFSGDLQYFPNPNYDQCHRDCIASCEASASGGGTPNPFYCNPNITSSPCYTGCQQYLKPPEDNWRALGSVANTNYFSFSPAQGLMQLNTNATVEFRVRVKSSTGQVSQWSPKSAPVIFLAPAPALVSAPTVDASCPIPFGPTGVIRITVNGAGNYHYILRNNFDNTDVCDPDNASKPCFSGDASGSASGLSFAIDKVNAGKHTLWVTNNGGEYGVCYTTANVDVSEISNLAINPVANATKADVSCPGGSDGRVTLASTGGKPNYIFKLTATLANSVLVNITNTSGLFENLKPATYTASVTDGCQQVTANTQTTFSINEPTEIKATLDSVALTCNSPADGKITVTIVDGPGNYNYTLSQNGTIVSSLLTTSQKNWISPPLPAGTYSMEVKDAQRLSCAGRSKSILLNPPPALLLTAANFTVDSVKCYNDRTGTITLKDLVMTGSYNYILSTTSGFTLTNTTETLFEKLAAGDYTITQKRATQCNDAYAYPVPLTVLQPAPITSNLVKTNISCYGKNDGKIEATTSGGTGSNLTKTWEFKTNFTWTTLSQTTATASQLIEGVYRLRLLDKKACAATSNEVIILEPALLEIDDVTVHDIQCLGEYGKLEVKSTGGTPPHTFQYALNGSSSFTTFVNNATLLSAGRYLVKIVDKNGCNVTQPLPNVVTTPLLPLDFTETLSDFNGFNISCFGGSNGAATLTATGGNGADYTGYTYALDGVFQSGVTLNGAYAGAHVLAVKDARGCIISKTRAFTQTSKKLIPQLLSQQNVFCYGDTNGSLNVGAEGGLGPFKFTLKERSLTQDNGLFNGLNVGNYTVSIVDKNNCDNNFTYTITAINPRMQIQARVTDVNCFDGNDGSIRANINGGVAPLQFKWNNQLSTSSEKNGLKSGTHTLQVIDKAGCTRDTSMVVSQPARPLAVNVITIPVCVGSTDGKITVTGAGGTPPYQYSIDGGLQYQPSSFFTKVGTGNYAIKVIDKNNCGATTQTVVIQRNDKPIPNFLVATKRNALDTLIITEISIPRPDSIRWIFDPAASIVNNNQWAPQIKFNAAGIYFVSMTGYFGGCDYSVRKDLTLNAFDPKAQVEKLPSFKPIESLTISPNPSTGEFDVSVKLNKKYNLSIVVYDMIGILHYQNNWDSINTLTQKIKLDVAPGIYLVRVITESDAKDTRVVITK